MDYKEVGNQYGDAFGNSGERSVSKIVFSILGFLMFIGVIAGLLFVFGGLFSQAISEKELIKGETLNVQENNSVKMQVGDEEHNIEIKYVGKDSVDIIIRSNPINLSLRINEIKEVDIDGDGVTDVMVKLIQIVDGKARIAIRKIETLRCIENWKCTEWSSCEKGRHERECFDLNECSGNFGKPPENKGCLEMESVNWDDNGNWSRERLEERVRDQVQNGSESATLRLREKVKRENHSNLGDNSFGGSDSVSNAGSLNNETDSYEGGEIDDDNSANNNQSLNNETDSYEDNETSDNSSSGDETMGEYADRLRNLDCSNYISSTTCGEINLNDLPEYSKTYSNGGVLNFSVGDESCELICFGEAFRGNCRPAKVNLINKYGTKIVLQILGLDNFGNCLVRMEIHEVENSDEQNGIYENTFLVCPLPLDVESLNAFSCNMDTCLEEGMPGQTTLGVFSTMGLILNFGNAEQSGCDGTMIDAYESYIDSLYNSSDGSGNY